MTKIINLTNRDVTVVVGDAVATFPRCGLLAVVNRGDRSLSNVIAIGNDVFVDVYKHDSEVSIASIAGTSAFPDAEDGTYYITTRDVALILRRKDVLIPSNIMSFDGGCNCTRFEVVQ